MTGVIYKRNFLWRMLPLQRGGKAVMSLLLLSVMVFKVRAFIPSDIRLGCYG